MSKDNKGIYTSLEIPKGYHTHRNGRDLEKYEYNPDFITFDTTPETSSSEEGTMYWDGTTHLPAWNTRLPGVVWNGPLEDWTPIRNNTGISIPNGTCVVGSAAADSEVFDVVPAIATENSITGSYGIVTSTLPTYVDGVETGEGWATTRGMVHDYDTTAFSPFNKLYISDTVEGGLTNSPPLPPSYSIPVGFAMDSQVDGTIYVYASNPQPLVASTNASMASGDPTGWHNGDDIVCEYDSTTRTITLTGVLKYSWRGQVRELTSPWTSVAHPATLDTNYFLYSTDGINFIWTEYPWGFTDIMVALAYYHTADKLAIREVHGIMPWQVHEEFHKVIHTYRESGGTLADYVLSSTVVADRRPTVSSAHIKDEDCNTTLPAIATNDYTQFSLTGTGDVSFTTSATDIIPLNVAQPYYNEFISPNWVQTLMPNNTYSCVWVVAVPATADAESQGYRYLWVQGQHNGTFEEQVALAPSDLNLGNLTLVFTEFVFCTKLIVRYTASDWRIAGVYNLTGTSASNVGSPAGVFLSVVNSDTTLSGLGTATDPLVVVDDGHNHSQLTSPDGLIDPVVYTNNSGSTFVNGTLDCAVTITARNAINYYGTGTFYMRNRVNGAGLSIGATTSLGALYYPFTIDATSDITYIGTSAGTAVKISGNGQFVVTVSDEDFIVQDTTDSPSYFIWRDHSASALYLGTTNAVATFRSTVDCNSNPITNATSLDMSGALTISSTAPAVYLMESGATAHENWCLVCDAGVMQFQSRSDAKAYQSTPLSVTQAGTVAVTGGVNASGYSTFSSSLGLGTDMIRAQGGSQLAIGAGESYSVMTVANTGVGEILWLGGESGARVVSSPDNWVSGWAGRYEASLLDATGVSSFPGVVSTNGFYCTSTVDINGGNVFNKNNYYGGRSVAGGYLASSSSVNCYDTDPTSHVSLLANNVADASWLIYTNVLGNIKHKLTANGNGLCDGAWTGGGADYAEYFEWSDGNPSGEDWAGHTLCLDGDKIRLSLPNDSNKDIIGAVSVNAGIIGNAAALSWSGMKERDNFGRQVKKEVILYKFKKESVDEEGRITIEDVKYRGDSIPEGVVIPLDAEEEVTYEAATSTSYDPDLPYIPRSERSEWGLVGLIGRLFVKKGQVVGDRWLKLKEVNEDIDEWLVR